MIKANYCAEIDMEIQPVLELDPPTTYVTIDQGIHNELGRVASNSFHLKAFSINNWIPHPQISQPLVVSSEDLLGGMLTQIVHVSIGQQIVKQNL